MRSDVALSHGSGSLLRELALFAGAGGGILGGRLLGWRTVCAVELDAFARRVLLARQRDGCLERFPIWDDVRTFDGTAWRGSVDVVSGGFPCQDISAAGRGGGITASRSGLWVEMARIVGEVRPRHVLVENSPVLTSRGLGRVLGDLAALGYDARWGVLGAHHAGAPHERDRIWIRARRRDAHGAPESVAHSDGARELQPRGVVDESGRRPSDGGAARGGQEVADAAIVGRDARWARDAAQEPRRREPDRGSVCEDEVGNAVCAGLEGQRELHGASREIEVGAPGWWDAEPDVGRMVDGLAPVLDRSARLRCIGNGQVPGVVRLAWETLA